MGIYIGNTTTIKANKGADASLGFKQFLHDIRSPITAIGACVNRLEQGPSDEAIKLLKLTFDRLIGMTNSNKLINKINISDVVKKIILEKQSNSNITLTANYGGHEAIGESSEFGVILSNLINNCLEADANRIHIEIQELANMIQIQIQDNGCGFAPKLQNFVGLPGFTTGKGTTGSGLGLSHAIETVKKWGGSLSISSLVNQGTTVTIKLRKS